MGPFSVSARHRPEKHFPELTEFALLLSLQKVTRVACQKLFFFQIQYCVSGVVCGSGSNRHGWLALPLLMDEFNFMSCTPRFLFGTHNTHNKKASCPSRKTFFDVSEDLKSLVSGNTLLSRCFGREER